jgi:hypothetical protein
MNRREKLLMAAVTGIAMGLSAPATEAADEKKGDVKCFGINGCGSSAKCAVSADDLKAFKTLFGDKEYEAKWGQSEAHGCGSSAKCGAMAKVLNWQPASAEKCKAGGGYVVEEKDGKKVARKV